MGRMYTAPFSGQAETLAVDLLEILAPSDGIIVIHEIGIGQTADVGDAEEEILLLHLKSGQTSTGTGGNTTAIVPVDFGDPVAGAVVKDTNTTKASGGTIVTHNSWAWNVRMQFQQIWTPETRPVISPSRRATLEMAAAPNDELTLNGYIVFEEIG